MGPHRVILPGDRGEVIVRGHRQSDLPGRGRHFFRGLDLGDEELGLGRGKLVACQAVVSAWLSYDKLGQFGVVAL